MKTLKVIGFLLNYPSSRLEMVKGEMKEILKAERWLSTGTTDSVSQFIDYLSAGDLLDLQEDYVALFDRTPSLALHLFEHVHGDSRDRGQALVELDMLYREAGLENVSEHTPDYLPLFLEYLSLLAPDEARRNLDGAIDVIAIIGERLKERNSAYVILFEALKEAASRKPDEKKLAVALKECNGAALSPEEMDAVWEEQFAFDNKDKGENGCPKAQDMLARINKSLAESEVRK